MDEIEFNPADALRVRDALSEADVLLLRLQRLARIGGWIQRMLPPGATLTISRRQRRNQWESVEEFTIDVRGGGIKNFSTAVDSLDDAVDGVSLEDQLRRCLSCDQLKRLNDFSHLAAGKRGYNRYCLKCESKRMADYKRKKRAENRRR